MRKQFVAFTAWCNRNVGFLTLILIFFAVIPLIPLNKIDFQSAGSFLTNNLTFPVYVVILIGVALVLYVFLMRRRFKRRTISVGFLAGEWQNEWLGDNFHGSEHLQITHTGLYLLNGQETFQIKNFLFNPVTLNITFTKVAVKPGDDRSLKNSVKLVNNNLLEGNEDGTKTVDGKLTPITYKIKYRRIT